MVEKLSIVLLAFVLLLTFCSKTKTQASGFNLSQLYETNYQLYNSSFDYSFNSGDSDSNLLNGEFLIYCIVVEIVFYKVSSITILT